MCDDHTRSSTQRLSRFDARFFIWLLVLVRQFVGNGQTKNTGISIAAARTIPCDFFALDLHDCTERGKLGGS
jgi:hypothetical protein